MGAVVKKGWEQYMLQLQLHPLRTKVWNFIFCSPLQSTSCSSSIDRGWAVGDHGRRFGRDQRFGGAEAFGHPQAAAEAAPPQSGTLQYADVVVSNFCVKWKFSLLYFLMAHFLFSMLKSVTCSHNSSMTPYNVLQIFGFAYGGPFGHFLHKLLEIIFKGKKDSKTVAKKVFLCI
ncbi:hypothetical protein BHM03_00031072 [Ensete ventricosum]|nr:hypothetical protein BHM03_00031072 [Ensete ventricosum]